MKEERKEQERQKERNKKKKVCGAIFGCELLTVLLYKCGRKFDRARNEMLHPFKGKQRHTEKGGGGL